SFTLSACSAHTAKLKAWSSSIQVTPSGNGSPSVCAHVRRKWDELDVSDGTSDRHSLSGFMTRDFPTSSIPYASNLFRYYEWRTITAILIPQWLVGVVIADHSFRVRIEPQTASEAL